jgi:hypothetical protein
VNEPGAVLLLAFVLAVVIRAFWVEIIQFVIFLFLLATVAGVITILNLLREASG